MENYKIYSMSFGKVYPLYIKKVERKGKSKAEVDAIIFWLTGYNKDDLESILENEIDFKTFFENAPKLNPARFLIKGLICGIRVENIEEPLMKEIRYLDKLIDELARGKSIDKIFRKEKV